MEEQISQVLPDIPRTLTALAEWMACMQCIMEVKRRLSGWRLAVVAGAALILQTVFLVATKGREGFWWFVCMFAAIGMMYAFIYICGQVNRKDAGYYCVRAFVLAEFAASLEWQLECYLRFEMGFESPVVRLACLGLVYLAVYAGSLGVYRKFTLNKVPLRITNKELLSCIIIGLAVFLMSNLGFASLKTPFSGQQMSEIFNVRTIIDLGGVAILYAYHIQRIDLRMRQELENVQNILHNQYIQYKQSQEAMDIINYKYHDLKHHIIALRAEENMQKKNEYLDQLEQELSQYEAQIRTGNKVLDTLLTSKSLYCKKNEVSMTCVVDGTLFDFMEVADICSIFGNALDNAIECEKKIQEKEKRLIHVSAFSQKSFLLIRFENYYEGELTFRENLPITTKKKKQYHGYGLKSIRYTVKKYGGEVDISTKDNWFSLKILIPI